MATTRLQQYAEALRFLRVAEEAIDQAHACMKDAQVDDVSTPEFSHAGRASTYTVATISKLTSLLLAEVEAAECGDCFHPIARHSLEDGCEFERGDVPMRCADGGDVMAAAGPCGCQWGSGKVVA